MKIALIIGHTGKPSKPFDRGCVDASGITEVSYVLRYVDSADSELRASGHTVFVIADGEYPERAKRADSLAPNIVIHCHVNAGGGNRAEVFHYWKSETGPQAAQAIANAMKDAFRCTAEVKPCSSRTNVRAFNCIKDIRATAIHFEPFFTDGPNAEQWKTPEALRQIGIALARGIMAWGNR